MHLCFAVTFFTSALFINLVQCILYLTLHKVNKRIYRKINYYLCCLIYSQLVFLGDWWSNSEIIFYIDRDDFDKYWGKEHAYCVMNHTYEIDWLIGWMICDRIFMLGNCKAYAKKVTQYIPMLGWCWKFSEFVFLERSFEKDKENIIRQVGELSDHPDPMWLLLFPEGTRFTKSKHQTSEEFAQQKNLQSLKYHLQPRTRGFTTSIQPMKGKVPAVYDILLAFNERDKVPPTITSLLLGKSVTAHMYMRRIPLEDVPDSEEAQSQLLRDMFQRKDRLKRSFCESGGDFFATSGVKRIEGFSRPRRTHALITMVVCMVSVCCPLVYGLVRLFASGEILYGVMGTGIITIFYLLLNRTISMSEISKGSRYGSDSPKKTE